MMNDEEDVKDAKRKGGDGKEIHGRDGFAVIFQEGNPLLHFVPIGSSPGKKAGHGSFGDTESELQELAMDSRGTPRRIFTGHTTDQTADLEINPRSAKRL